MSSFPCISLLAITLFLTDSYAENRVLFIGNSFTIGSGESVAEIFDALAIAGGHDDPQTVLRADGGKDYQWHTNNAPTQAAITSDVWTHVVLQNYSTGPTHVRANGVGDHFTYGTQLYGQIIANSQATQVILFETWSRAANHALITGESTPSTFATTAEFQSELRTNYNALADQLTANHPGNPAVIVAPVGDAWENAGGLLAESDPNFTDLHASDNYHGNDNGYFLAAAVFYGEIYGESPEGLHSHAAVTALGLSLTEDAGFLEQIAWETSSANVPLEFLSHPASQTVDVEQAVTFNASVRGSRPTSVKWYQNDTLIAGADTLTYHIASAGLELDGTLFKVEATNAVGAITSDEATLTVVADTTPPTLEGAATRDGLVIEVSFSEGINLPPGGGGFTLVNKGRRIPIVSAEVSLDGTVVALTLGGPISGGFVVVPPPDLADRSGNPIAPGAITTGMIAEGGASRVILIDVGSSGASTGPNDDPPNSWNNLSSVGTTDTGVIENLILSDGSGSGVSLEMVRRFNGANGSGTTAASNYPASASQDSLYGNTEVFGGSSDIFPAFRLAGLDPLRQHQLTLYASRLGASDNRETRYTITGAETISATLNAAGNVDGAAVLGDIFSDSNGGLLIELSPSPNNNNTYHFTYLGALSLSSPGPDAPGVPEFYQPMVEGEHAIIDWRGIGELETTTSLSERWAPVLPAPAPPYIVEIVPPARRFYRLKYEVTE